jgi:hypothetical protein
MVPPSVPSSGRSFNVLGLQRGRGQGTLVVGAHLDARNQAWSDLQPSPGAEDNASGCAAVLETARVLRDYRFDADILYICYGLEERGLYGGRAHAAAQTPSQILGVINMDMIAYEGDGRLDVSLQATAPGFGLQQRLADNAARYTALEVEVAQQTCCSDHQPYLDLGMPAVLLIENDYRVYPQYHTVNDTPDRISDAMAHEILKMAVATAAEVAKLRNGSRYSGYWFDPAQSGHGFQIEVQDSGQVFLTWYTFAANGERLWVIASGAMNGSSAILNAHEVVGGAFPPAFDPARVQVLPWGSFELAFNACDGIRIPLAARQPHRPARRRNERRAFQRPAWRRLRRRLAEHRQQGQEFGCRLRATEQETLGEIAAHVAQAGQRGFVFDTFGDGDEIEMVGEIDHRMHQPRRTRVAADVEHEFLVDLQFGGGKPLEIGEGRITDAEIVDRDAETVVAQLTEHNGAETRILHDRTLGHLEHDVGGRHVPDRDGVPELLDQAGLVKDARTQVDREAQALSAGARCGRMAQGGVDAPARQRFDQAGLFREQHEVGRADRAMHVAVPARQRFGADHATGPDVPERLQEDFQPIVDDGLAQVDIRRLDAHAVRLEQLIPVARRQRLRERLLGGATQGLRSIAMLREHRDADGRQRLLQAVADQQGLAKGAHQPVRRQQGMAAVAQVRQDQREGVVADRQDAVLGTQRAADARTCGHAQEVAEQLMFLAVPLHPQQLEREVLACFDGTQPFGIEFAQHVGTIQHPGAVRISPGTTRSGRARKRPAPASR